MTARKCLVFSFAGIQVREREFRIVRNGEAVAVEPKAFRVLLFLLHNPKKLITKEELLDAVWSDVAVSENSLTRSIATLRRLLEDDVHEPRFIATVPTVGYRFLCDVVVADDAVSGMDTADLSHPGTENGFGALEAESPGARRLPDRQSQMGLLAEKLEEKTHQQLSDEAVTRSRRLVVLGLIAAAIVVVIGFAFNRTVKDRSAATRQAVQSTGTSNASSRMRIVPLTNLPGWVRYPAFSPDGEKIAFIWNGENPVMGDLYVQLIGGERPLRLTHTRAGTICCADWSPDGREIAFSRCDDRGGGVFTVPALGGAERRRTDVMCPFGDAGYPKWIDDGKMLLLADSCTPGGPRGLVLFSLETGDKRCLTVPPLYSEFGDSHPVISPDGNTVAFLRNTTLGSSTIYTVALSGGTARQLTPDDWRVSSPMWSSDGRHIIFNSGRSALSSRLWRILATGGTIQPETVYPRTGALSRNGRRLAYVEPDWFWVSQAFVISRMELTHAGGQVISQKPLISSDGGNQSAQPSPDGQQLVFQSGRTGRTEIWRSNADGTDQIQITSFDGGFSGTPRWSPDGKWIAFDHHEDPHSQIYLVDSEGRKLHAITSGNCENLVPSWSRDGTAVYFASNRSGTLQVWRRQLATGLETQITHLGGFAALESYDGKTLYYSKFEGGGIWSVPIGGGEEHQITDKLHRGYWGDFAVTDIGVYLLDSEASPKPTLMFYNFQSHLLLPVLQLDNPFPEAVNLAASRDGLTLWTAQATPHSSLAMVENF